MKVKELIAILSNHNPESMVVVRGYEGGVDEVNYASVCILQLNVYADWYMGKHEIIDEADFKPADVSGDDKKMSPAVRIHV